MKIVTKGKTYIQKSDIAYLESINSIKTTRIGLDVSLFDKLTGSEYINYDFVECDDELLKLVDQSDYLLDYDFIKQLNKTEVLRLCRIKIERKQEIEKTFKLMDYSTKIRNQSLVTEYEVLSFQIESLRNILLYKEDKKELKLPKVFRKTIKK